MEEVDLKNFKVVKNEKGVVFINNSNVMLQNTITGEVLTTAYDNVASFYNLDNSAAEQMEDDNSPDYVPDMSFKDAPDSSSDDAQIREETNYRSFIKWERDETNYLLELYRKYIKQVGIEKRFRTKKMMWTHIASLIKQKYKISPNATQVESRFKCIARRQRRKSEINAKTATQSAIEDIFAKTQREDPIGIETVLPASQIFMASHKKPGVKQPQLPPPAPADLLQMLPPSDMEDGNDMSDIITPGKRCRRPYQIIMFEKYLQQKAKFYERREAKSDEKTRLKIERQKEKEQLKQQRLNDKIEREREREQMKQKRHADKMQLLRELIKSSSN